jgi:hypothetical protein
MVAELKCNGSVRPRKICWSSKLASASGQKSRNPATLLRPSRCQSQPPRDRWREVIQFDLTGPCLANLNMCPQSKAPRTRPTEGAPPLYLDIQRPSASDWYPPTTRGQQSRLDDDHDRQLISIPVRAEFMQMCPSINVSLFGFVCDSRPVMAAGSPLKSDRH